jgi:serine/threonine protein kinase
MAAGPLPVAEALRYAIALAEALREVHSRGRIYAFLQPAGVAVLDGQVRLAPGGPTPVSPYFSPEQVAGRDLDSRTDIFSLGAMIYEMLSGRRAFDAATRTALRIEILSRQPAPLENAPPALARLVCRCLEKKPERRVQRIEILLAELKLQEIIARPMDPIQPGPRPVTRMFPPHP